MPTAPEELTSSLRDLVRVIEHRRRQRAQERPGLPTGALDTLVLIADRRATLLAVTAAGREVRSDAERWYADVLHRALGDWCPADVAAPAGGIDRLTSGLDEAFDATRSRTTTRDLEDAR